MTDPRFGGGRYVRPIDLSSRFRQSRLERTAPGKATVGERPKLFGEAHGFGSIKSTLIFGEYDAALLDAMMSG